MVELMEIVKTLKHYRNSLFSLVIDCHKPFSSLLLMTMMTFILFLFANYDWNWPFVKFLCLTTWLSVVLFIKNFPTPISWQQNPGTAQKMPGAGQQMKNPKRADFLYWTELFGLSLFLLIVSIQGIDFASRYFWEPPQIDIGDTTLKAVKSILAGINPYASQDLAPLGDDPTYWGFKYGPTMILAYLPAGFLPPYGMKALNTVYFGAVIFMFWKYATALTTSRRLATGTFLFAAGALLFSKRIFWQEIYWSGVIDLFPTLLMLIAIFFLGQEFHFAAGLLVGLSITAKFSPGVFLLALFLRRGIPIKLIVGVALGFCMFIPAVVADPTAFIKNAFIFHFIKPADSTSIRTLLPDLLNSLLSLLPLLVLLVLVIKRWNESFQMNWTKPDSMLNLIRDLLILTTVNQLAYKEVHLNHLLWTLPFLAIYFSYYRHSFLFLLLRLLQSTSEKSANSVKV